ncbi:MAG: hypothetical protein K8S16_14470 [Bacteroidales bacterium]|nr:hypothetical protein [Bacteroidales bacterium]
MIRYTTLLMLLFCFSVSLEAQDTISPTKPARTGKPLKDKIYFGGSLGAFFGNYTRIAVYPLVGFRVTDKFRTGLQLGYEYISDKRYYTNFEASNYGASIFAQYNIIPQLYFHVEPALWNYDGYYVYEDNSRIWVPYLYVGAGLSQQLGPRSVAYIQIKFDLLQDSRSPYDSWSPFYDIGVGVGF